MENPDPPDHHEANTNTITNGSSIGATANANEAGIGIGDDDHLHMLRQLSSYSNEGEEQVTTLTTGDDGDEKATMLIIGEDENGVARTTRVRFPPGIRFEPTDEELMVSYLIPKLRNLPVPPTIIRSINVYKYSPEELTEKFKRDVTCKEWYFFTPRDKKYPNGSRPSRAAGNGYWKATGADHDIKNRNNETVGVKKSLVYFRGKPGLEGMKTRWIMHEFRVLRDQNKKTSSGDMKLDNWVLCRIQNKASEEEQQKDSSSTHETANCQEKSQGDKVEADLEKVCCSSKPSTHKRTNRHGDQVQVQADRRDGKQPMDDLIVSHQHVQERHRERIHQDPTNGAMNQTAPYYNHRRNMNMNMEMSMYMMTNRGGVYNGDAVHQRYTHHYMNPMVRPYVYGNGVHQHNNNMRRSNYVHADGVHVQSNLNINGNGVHQHNNMGRSNYVHGDGVHVQSNLNINGNGVHQHNNMGRSNYVHGDGVNGQSNNYNNSHMNPARSAGLVSTNPFDAGHGFQYRHQPVISRMEHDIDPARFVHNPPFGDGFQYSQQRVIPRMEHNVVPTNVPQYYNEGNQVNNNVTASTGESSSAKPPSNSTNHGPLGDVLGVPSSNVFPTYSSTEMADWTSWDQTLLENHFSDPHEFSHEFDQLQDWGSWNLSDALGSSQAPLEDKDIKGSCLSDVPGPSQAPPEDKRRYLSDVVGSSQAPPQGKNHKGSRLSNVPGSSQAPPKDENRKGPS